MTDSTTVTVTEPDVVETKKVDTSGRVYVGREYIGEHVRIVIERVEGESDE